LLKIVIIMPITTRLKKASHKADGADKSHGTGAAADTIVGDPCEFIAEDNVKKTLSPVIGKAKKKAGSRKKLAKGQTSVTSTDGKDKVVKGSRKKINGKGSAEAKAKLVGKTDEKVAVTADAKAETKGTVEKVSEVTTDAEAKTKLVGKTDEKVVVTADAEAKTKLLVEEVAEVSTKLVGKTDEKVVVTADAEAETKLPVEEVAEVSKKQNRKMDEKVAVLLMPRLKRNYRLRKW
jgi:hypothetical protein